MFIESISEIIGAYFCKCCTLVAQSGYSVLYIVKNYSRLVPWCYPICNVMCDSRILCDVLAHQIPITVCGRKSP